MNGNRMKKPPIYKTMIAGFIFYGILLSLSFVFNMLIFDKEHQVVAFFRPEGHPLSSVPALAITAILWSMLVSYSYRVFGKCLKIENSVAKGAAYGALIFLFFMWYTPVFNFQNIDFELGILLGDLLTYGLALPLGGVIIVLFHK